ncbi:flagellin FlaB [Methanomicrobium sp. W14]|uniref:flagellin n=1 Tax=Methanomicrobium sp. W14 TaxID=2817839 RepID=UPI001AE3596E|nr:flagellin [Methanomicrobium sp. W14]MBP2133594.1 flagellin FlaB [Methanomicrobium sp. W14]
MDDKSEAFTGLEAAIVLIAFVVVASVFSFAVLGAGFFTTDKTQDVLYSSVQSAGAMPQLLGNVYGLKGENGIGSIRYSISLSPGGDILDLSSMVVTWSTSENIENIEPNDPLYSTSIDKGHWGIIDRKPSSKSNDNFLESGETFTILIHLDSLDELSENEKFTVEMKSPSSGVFIVSGNAPYQVDKVNILY